MELNNIDTANPNPSSSSSVVSSGVKTRLDSCAKEDPFTNANSNTIVVTDAQPEPSQLRDISRYSLIFSNRAAVLSVPAQFAWLWQSVMITSFFHTFFLSFSFSFRLIFYISFLLLFFMCLVCSVWLRIKILNSGFSKAFFKSEHRDTC